MFKHLIDAINWVQSQLKFRPKTSLEHVKKALEMLSLDMSKIKKVHVTGTNGKGSVCMFITKILVDAGYKVGTFTSPYLIDFNERIKLNNENINDSDLLVQLNKIYALNERYKNETGETLSFFELLTLAAFDYFSEEEVDVMVVEVGIGGLLDSTNIINYDASVITNVGFDHMKQLGNTLESIASNKLGILKNGNQLFTTVSSELHEFFINYCKQMNADYKIIDINEIESISDFPNVMKYNENIYKLSLLGNHQQQNAALAIEVVEFLFPKIDYHSINQSLSTTVYPGRLETVLDNVLLDGAHNMHAINSLIFSLHSTFKMYNIHVLFSALSDKEPVEMLKVLALHVKSITTTAFPDTRYESLAFLPYRFENDPKIALSNLIKNKKENDLVIITGSLHFVGYMKKEIIPYLK